ncbi:MAG: RAD55 family ATPase [Halobacteriales archaeon]
MVKREDERVPAMARLPFGVRRLDALCGGGAPAGSLVMVAGEPGAGARAFLSTTVLVNGLARTDPQRFELTYGELADGATEPEEIHYVTLTAGRASLEREWREAFDQAMVTAGLKAVSVADLSAQYFAGIDLQIRGDTEKIGYLPEEQPAGDRVLLDTLTEYLEAHGPAGLIAVDSLTDLGTLPEEQSTWREIAVLLRAIRRAADDWGGLVLLLVDPATVSARTLAQLRSAVHGTLRFEWATGGYEMDRTLVIEQFRGVLPTIDAEDLVRFETRIDEDGFTLSDVRKIH